MIKKPILIIIFFFYSVNHGEAQTKRVPKDTSSTVIIYYSEKPKNAVKISSESNIIKISPAGFLSGKIPLTFERKITDLFSIQVGAGATSKNITRFQVRETLRPVEDDKEDYESSPLPGGVYDQADPRYNYDHRKEGFGYMYGIQPRFYLANQGLHGRFLGVSAYFYRFNSTIPGLTKGEVDLMHTGASKKEHENIRDIMIHFGGQALYDQLSMEYSLGVGLRNVNGAKYVAGEDLNTGKLYEGEHKYARKDMSFGVGFKVGYHF